MTEFNADAKEIFEAYLDPDEYAENSGPQKHRKKEKKALKFKQERNFSAHKREKLRRHKNQDWDMVG